MQAVYGNIGLIWTHHFGPDSIVFPVTIKQFLVMFSLAPLAGSYLVVWLIEYPNNYWINYHNIWNTH